MPACLLHGRDRGTGHEGGGLWKDEEQSMYGIGQES